MNIKQQFTEVTRFSKAMALLMLIALPFIGFCLGVKFQKSITPLPQQILVPTTNTQKTSSDPTKNQLLPTISPQTLLPIPTTKTLTGNVCTNDSQCTSGRKCFPECLVRNESTQFTPTIKYCRTQEEIKLLKIQCAAL